MTKFSGSDAAVSVCAIGGVAVAGVAAYFSYRYLAGKCCQGGSKKNMVNPDIQKDSEKVVHSFDIEDLGDKQSYCRCWRSKKFPMCDGSHNKHNAETGDNVGPLCIGKKKA